MENTPCLRCLHLRGAKGAYRCGSQREKLDDEIALGTDVRGLPDCPFFEDKRYLSDFMQEREIPLDDDSLVVGVRPKKREPYSPRLKTTPLDDSLAEIHLIVRDSYKKRKKWPTCYYVFTHSRFQSIGTVYNMLELLVSRGLLIKHDPQTVSSRIIYSIPER